MYIAHLCNRLSIIAVTWFCCKRKNLMCASATMIFRRFLLWTGQLGFSWVGRFESKDELNVFDLVSLTPPLKLNLEFWTKLSLQRIYPNLAVMRDVVRMSTIWSSMLTYFISRSPLTTLSLIKCTFISMCLIR